MPTKKKPKTEAQLRRKREREVKSFMLKAEKDRIRKAKSRDAQKSLTIEDGPDTIPNPNEDKVRECLLEFDNRCKGMSHKNCISCRMTGLSISPNRNGHCSSCAKRSDKHYYENNNSLPIWYDDEGKAQYRVPLELSILTHAEKILIQRVSPFVALTHIKNGTMGLCGHVCAFEQDIEGFAQVLPRTPDDATVIKVVRSMKTEIGGKNTSVLRSYLVRKRVIHNALMWLQRHHADYKEIRIDESNLDWIDGDEGYLQGLEIEEGLESRNDSDDGGCNNDDENSCYSERDDCEELHELPSRDDDLGPSIQQTTMKMKGDDVSQFGYIDEGGNAELSRDDAEINRLLQEAVKKSPNAKHVAMIWPRNSIIPVDEYGDTRIFVNAFPWLFPGGIGDVKDFPSNEGKLHIGALVRDLQLNMRRLTLCTLFRRLGEDANLLRRWEIHERSHIRFLCTELHHQASEFKRREVVCRQIQQGQSRKP